MECYLIWRSILSEGGCKPAKEKRHQRFLYCLPTTIVMVDDDDDDDDDQSDVRFIFNLESVCEAQN